MSDLDIIVDGVRYSTTRDASSACGVSANYITRFCREGFVRGRIVGGVWYVDIDSLKAFLSTQDLKKQEWRTRLSTERKRERHLHEKASVPRAHVAPPSLHRYHSTKQVVSTAHRQSILVAGVGTLVFIASLGFCVTFAVPSFRSDQSMTAASAGMSDGSFFDDLFTQDE